MPSLGGITAWISIGDVVLAEYGTEVDDDQVKCYVEVPQGFPPSMPPTAGVTDSPSGSMSSPQHAPLPLSPALVPLEYAINWKIQDLTYTMVAVAKIDGALEIEKIHLGKGTITAAKNTQSIDSVPITDDWSKRRLLTFVKLHAAEHGSPPKEPIGSIQLSLYRSGRASLSSGFKTSATGFHTKTTPDPKSLIKETTVDGLYSKSHATGLGPITFGPPKKVWTAPTRDQLPYVTFEFLYRSRELIQETLPDEGWELTPAGGAMGEFPTTPSQPTTPLKRGRTRNESSHPPVTFSPSSGGASLPRRPSITGRAKKWASDVKQSTQSIRLHRNKDASAKVEVVGTPLDAIKNPFAPRANDLPRTPADSLHDGEQPPPVPAHDDEDEPEPVDGDAPVASSSKAA